MPRSRCKSCCVYCRGNPPASYTLTIGEAEYVLWRVSKPVDEWSQSFPGQAAACHWAVFLDPAEAIFCDDAVAIELRLIEAPGGEAQFMLAIFKALDEIPPAGYIALYGSEPRPAPLNCHTSQAVLFIGANCPGLPEELTLTPGGPNRCGCPCDGCCMFCRGDSNITALRWAVTIAGQTYIARRDVFAAAEDEIDACIWRGSIERELCGVYAKNFRLRAYYNPVLGSTGYRFDLEVYDAAGSLHSMWRYSIDVIVGLECGEPHTLTGLAGSHCFPSNATITPVKMKLCELPDGTHETHCACCPLADDPDEIDVDFGTPGFLTASHGYSLTSDTDCDVLICDNCPDVGGTYTTSRLTIGGQAQCAWRYQEDICGDRDSFRIWREPPALPITCTNDRTRLVVTTSRVVSGTQCYWRVRAGVFYGCTSSSEIGSSETWAEYRSALTGAGSCALETPVSLTKYDANGPWTQCGLGAAAGSRSPTACLGNWPDTITIAAAA